MEIALTSLVHAIEKVKFKHLDTVTLSNIRPTDITALSSLAMGAHPGSAKSRSNIRVLDITMSSGPNPIVENDQMKLLRKYIRSHKGLHRFSFRWIGTRGPSPLPELAVEQNTHPAFRNTALASSTPLFPHLKHLTLSNVVISALHIQRLMQTHKTTLTEVELENVVLVDGTWHDALSTTNGVELGTNPVLPTEQGDVPIMLAPGIFAPHPQPKKSKAEHRGQASEATNRARKLLLADEYQQVESSSLQARKFIARDRKRKKVKEVTTSPVQQLKRKCGDLFGWKMKNGPTLVVG
ncbi:unnamed protein product [Aureobasidium uvarum]|uniref:Uncharacterized protein n=1 Tax=Aureobasidium uvarum TaxID=2773716 RepID=A0A9N8K7P0_9PEZI|nr:unnamed protein product [Aureobasidium uvarum]